jgi:hypothetical protein
MSSSVNAIASDTRAQLAADGLSATPAAAPNDTRARDEFSSSLDEQVRAAKRQRSTAIAVTQASSELRSGLVVGASGTACFKAMDAFATLAQLGQLPPVQQVRQLLVKLQSSYPVGTISPRLTEAAQSMCNRLSPVNLQLLRQLFDELLSCKPSLTIWPFVSALSTSCDGKLPPAVRTQYIDILRALFSDHIRGGYMAGALTLIHALMQCECDIDQPNAAGNTPLLECGSAQCYKVEELLQALMDLGATPWVSNSVTKQTLLHIWMDKDQFDIVRDILLERGPWADLLPLLDWWAPDDKGRTPLQVAQEKARTPIHQYTDANVKRKVEAAIAVTELLPTLLQHWKQTERPLLVQSLVEHASLCSDVAQLVLSYVDGQERA